MLRVSFLIPSLVFSTLITIVLDADLSDEVGSLPHSLCPAIMIPGLIHILCGGRLEEE